VGARPVRRSTQGGQKIRRKKPAAACGEGCSSTLVLTQRYSIEKMECRETRTKFGMRYAVIIVNGEEEEEEEGRGGGGGAGGGGLGVIWEPAQRSIAMKPDPVVKKLTKPVT